MPSRLTYTLVEKGQTFRDFLLGCARHCNACLHQRDDSPDELPKVREVDAYYYERVKEEQTELLRLRMLSPAEVEKEYIATKAEIRRLNAESRKRAEPIAARIEAMQKQVNAWEPPSADHDGLKDLMLRQLEQTMQYDGTAFQREEPADPPGEWHQARIDHAVYRLDHAKTNLRSQLNAVRRQRRWIEQLYESIDEV